MVENRKTPVAEGDANARVDPDAFAVRAAVSERIGHALYLRLQVGIRSRPA